MSPATNRIVTSSVPVRPRSRGLTAERAARLVGQAVGHAFLVLLAVAAVLPFVWMALNSFKFGDEIIAIPPTFIPQRFTLRAYEEIFTKLRFGTALLNSIIVAVIATASVLFVSSIAGYIFAKYKFVGKEILFMALLSSMMVPFTVTLIPLYVLVSKLGLVNSLQGLIVTELVSTFGIFLLRQFIETLPSELLDAARVDGASEWWIYSRVVVPLSTASLGALAIFTFIGSWDSYLWPLIMLTSPDKITLPVALRALQNINYTRYDILLTGATVTVLPVLLVYLVFQRHFVRGIALTGSKM